ncbi:hypothetical protein HZS_7220, partial [Henneguya salminicola]
MARYFLNDIHECIFNKCENGFYNFCVEGGAEFGQLIVIGSLFTEPQYGKAVPGDIIMEINEIKVSGLTQYDVISIIDSVEYTLTLVMKSKDGCFTSDIRVHLSNNYKKGCKEDLFQDTIRFNLYRNAIPITTNSFLHSNINAFKLVTFEEFYSMEENGKLLEVAYYDENLYGTPKPSKKLKYSDTKISSILSADIKKTEEKGFNMTELRNLTQVEHTINSVCTASNTSAQRWMKKIKKRLSEGNSHARDSKEYTILRHYAVWLEKGKQGFGLKILSVWDENGIFTKPGEPLDSGKPVLQLRDVVVNSPAYMSGIMKPGDVFLRINDEEIRDQSHQDIKTKLNNFSIGSVVKFVLSRAVKDDDANISISSEAFRRINKLSRDQSGDTIKHGSICSHNPVLIYNKKPYKNGFIFHESKNDQNFKSHTKNSKISDLNEEIKESDYYDEKSGSSPSIYSNNTIQSNQIICVDSKITEKILKLKNGYEFTLWPIPNAKNNSINSLLVVHSLYSTQLTRGDFIVSINGKKISNLNVDKLIKVLINALSVDFLLLKIIRYNDEYIPIRLEKIRNKIIEQVERFYPPNSIFYYTINNTRPVGYGLIFNQTSKINSTDACCIDRILLPELIGIGNLCHNNYQLFSISGVISAVISQEMFKKIGQYNKPLQISLY